MRPNQLVRRVKEAENLTLKTELIHHRSYKTRQEARSDIFNYIESFYNPKRRHSSLGYRSPTEYEMINKAA